MCVFNVFVIVRIVTNRANISYGEVNSALRWSSGKEYIFISGTSILFFEVAPYYTLYSASVLGPWEPVHRLVTGEKMFLQKNFSPSITIEYVF